MHAELDGGVASPGWAAPVTASSHFQRQAVPLLQPAPRLQRLLKQPEAPQPSTSASGRAVLQTSRSGSNRLGEAGAQREAPSGQMQTQQSRMRQPALLQRSGDTNPGVSSHLLSPLGDLLSYRSLANNSGSDD